MIQNNKGGIIFSELGENRQYIAGLQGQVAAVF